MVAIVAGFTAVHICAACGMCCLRLVAMTVATYGAAATCSSANFCATQPWL
jgi:hypothetical protein